MTHPWDTIRTCYQGHEPGSIDLVANIRSLPIDPYRLHDHAILRRASAVEIEHFRTIFRVRHALARAYRNPLETRAVHQPSGNSGMQILFEPLAAEEFRYHVLECDELNHNHDVRQASPLASFELQLGPGWDYGGPFDFGLTPQGIDFDAFLFEARADDDPLIELSIGQLDELRWAYSAFLSHDDATVSLRSVTSDYLDLRRVSTHSNLRFLGLFALLESLITHAPEESDPYSSITRQLKKKIALLNNRFSAELPYAKHFPGTHPDTVWSKLQALRSTIAHGHRPAFDKGLQSLGTLSNAEAFLRSALKSVMAHALKEPRLLADLRDC